MILVQVQFLLRFDLLIRCCLPAMGKASAHNYFILTRCTCNSVSRLLCLCQRLLEGRKPMKPTGIFPYNSCNGSRQSRCDSPCRSDCIGTHTPLKTVQFHVTFCYRVSSSFLTSVQYSVITRMIRCMFSDEALRGQRKLHVCICVIINCTGGWRHAGASNHLEGFF